MKWLVKIKSICVEFKMHSEDGTEDWGLPKYKYDGKGKANATREFSPYNIHTCILNVTIIKNRFNFLCCSSNEMGNILDSNLVWMSCIILKKHEKMMKMTIDFLVHIYVCILCYLSAYICVYCIFPVLLQKGYNTFDDNKMYTLYITNSCRMSQSIFTSISINYDRWSPCCCPFHPIFFFLLHLQSSLLNS